MNKFVYRTENDNVLTTTIENIFINEFMPSAKGDYVKVYLYGLKNSQNPQFKPLSNLELADLLGLEVSDILDAYKYWADQGIVKIEKFGSDNIIVYCKINELLHKDPSLAKKEETVIPEFLKQDPMFVDMVHYIEKMFGGRNLSTNFIKTMKEWMDVYDFEANTVAFLVEEFLNSVDDEKYSMEAKLNYLKKMALSWYKEGIRTYHDASRYVENNRRVNQLCYMILKYMGLQRKPALNDKKFVRKWLCEYNFNEEMILEAVSRSNVSNLRYIDTILCDWYSKGWTKINDITEKSFNKQRSSASFPEISSQRQEEYQKIQDSILDSYIQEATNFLQ